jgi:hypothetical protein
MPVIPVEVDDEKLIRIVRERIEELNRGLRELTRRGFILDTAVETDDADMIDFREVEQVTIKIMKEC